MITEAELEVLRSELERAQELLETVKDGVEVAGEALGRARGRFPSEELETVEGYVQDAESNLDPLVASIDAALRSVEAALDEIDNIDPDEAEEDEAEDDEDEVEGDDPVRAWG